MAGEETVELELDPNEFARVMREIKGLDKALATAIRKSIRNTAKLVITDVQAEIHSYPAKRYNTGMRDQLARSLAVRIGTAKGGTKQGVFIVSTGRLLPANKKALVKTMNRAQFRHPVFSGGRRGTGQGRTWADQSGMRYFRQSIVAGRESQLTAALRAAVDQATEALNT